VAMNGAFGANATVAHRFTCFTYGCWYAIVASPRTAPPPFDEMIEGRGLSKRRAGGTHSTQMRRSGRPG
jgi:hypothetical protein